MPTLLEEGLAHFNAGRFYEAHEVWEDLWRMTEGRLKTCYQGLIQAAVGLHHLNRSNVDGARSQLRKSIRNLETCPIAEHGLDISDLIRQLARALETIAEAQPLPVRIARLK